MGKSAILKTFSCKTSDRLRIKMFAMIPTDVKVQEMSKIPPRLRPFALETVIFILSLHKRAYK